jgi:hypothetical protein
MSLKDGIPKQWGQYHLKKLIEGDPDPFLENWKMFGKGSSQAEQILPRYKWQNDDFAF